jgi:hypothetical protein
VFFQLGGDPDTQTAIEKAATLAFFNAHLLNDLGACAFLVQEFAEHPDLVVE